MLSEEDIERLRRLSPSDRVRMGLDATRLAWRFLRNLTPEECQRRLDRAREPWNPPVRDSRSAD
jgi:hypothetical protein